MGFVTNFVFLIQFDSLFVIMEICLFWAPVIIPKCVFPPGCTWPITVHILTSTQPVVKLMENFSRE